jgi:uncharacterized membrane protein
VTNRWDTGRTEAFSDGVFAIAITLLILDVSVPESDFHDLWRGIAHQWPAYLGYATSFVTIGGIWLAHHGMFRRLRYANNQVARINLVLLMAVGFLPFPTRLMSEAIHNTDAERAAVVFYGASLLVISILLTALWASVARHPELLYPEVTPEEVGAILQAAAPNLGFYVLLMVIAVLFPQVAAFGYLAIGIGLVVRARARDTPEPTPEPA